MGMTQNDRLLSWLQSGRSITQREADELWGCTRLGARVYDLKQQGHRIIKETETGVNRFGDKTCYARYRMVRA